VEELSEVALFREQYGEVRMFYPALSPRRTVHEVVRRIINRQVVDLIETSTRHLDEAAPTDIDAVRMQGKPLIVFSDGMHEQNLELKRFLRTRLYRHYRVHRMTAKAARTITALFSAFLDDPRLLPSEVQQQAAMKEEQHGKDGRARVVADYIAGMTDRYAIAEYERTFNPGI
jgi:dGTPase